MAETGVNIVRILGFDIGSIDFAGLKSAMLSTLPYGEPIGLLRGSCGMADSCRYHVELLRRSAPAQRF
jgi:hypothetical protein